MASPNVLLVEGHDDLHVIKNLLKRESIDLPIEIIDCGGIDPMLERIPVQLKASGLKILGIVLDADESVSARFDAIRNILTKSGMSSFPKAPEPNGTIVRESDLTVGVWVMPDNVERGKLEDFVALLIEPSDDLKPMVNTALDEIYRTGVPRYKTSDRSKAFIHTWLAWQESPGRPMGLAITMKYLTASPSVQVSFTNWVGAVFKNP